MGWLGIKEEAKVSEATDIALVLRHDHAFLLLLLSLYTMSWLPLLLFFSSSMLIGYSWADQGVVNSNEINTNSEEGAVEGRHCATCGSSRVAGFGTDSHGSTTTSHTSTNGGYGTSSTHNTHDHFDLDLSSLLGISTLGINSLLSKGTTLSYGLFALPILGVNIAILVILGILLMHVKKLTYVDSGTGGDVYYAAAPAYHAEAPSTYQSYDSGYHRRSTEEGRGMDSPSTFQFVSQMVLDAIEKYSEVETE